MMSQTEINRRSLGVTFNAGQEANVVVWAPSARQVTVSIQGNPSPLPLTKDDSGYWHTTTSLLHPGDLYTFVLDDEKECADPASLLQPQGVYGPSQAVDTNAFYWEDTCWINPPLDTYKTYEVDVHTFTEVGTFSALVKKLAYLKTLGANAIIIKPVTPFPDSRSWQPDGVFLYAVQASYGGPTQLQHLVNACHYEGIAVIIDLTYNHDSNQGTFYRENKPYSTRKHTFAREGGASIHERQREARARYVVENALMWFRDFHVDALRLNDIHLLSDLEHTLTEIRSRTNELTAITGRHHCLLVEQVMPETSQNEPNSNNLQTKTLDGYDRYCFDPDAAKNKAKTYREDYLYDEPFSTALQQFFGQSTNGQPDKSFVLSFAGPQINV